MPEQPLHVLLIEDDPTSRTMTTNQLRRIESRRFLVTAVDNYDDGLAALLHGEHDVCLLDYWLGERDGLELLREAKEKGCSAPIILLTGQEDRNVDLQAMEAGAADYLIKGVVPDKDLERSIRYSVTTTRALQQVRDSETRLADALEQEKRGHDDLLSILNQLGIGVAMTDEAGRVTFVNQAAEQIFGIRPEDAVNCHWESLWSLNPDAEEQLRNTFHTSPKQRSRVGLHFETHDGRARWVDVEVKDDPRSPERMILLFYDTSEVHDLRRQLEGRAQCGDLVGKSPAMLMVYDQIRDMAQVDTTVLIQGETGSGKELVSRAIHGESRRAEQPFIAVNCAGLTESLLASQLFGHKRGSFTGAVEDHQGYFEAADGGTIFLDEIGDLPLGMQTSLLRVLQEREITRVGESKPRKIDVRVIAATNQDLSLRSTQGEFRQDLLYRIRVAGIHLPPLRERREDIPALTDSFLTKLRAEMGKTVEHVSQDAMRVLLAHDWPGNVRELHSAIEVAMIRCKGAAILPDDLPREVMQPSVVGNPGGALPASQDERTRILAAVNQCGGNRSKAAQLLGMSRATFYRRLQSLDLPLDR